MVSCNIGYRLTNNTRDAWGGDQRKPHGQIASRGGGIVMTGQVGAFA